MRWPEVAQAVGLKMCEALVEPATLELLEQLVSALEQLDGYVLRLDPCWSSPRARERAGAWLSALARFVIAMRELDERGHGREALHDLALECAWWRVFAPDDDWRPAVLDRARRRVDEPSAILVVLVQRLARAAEAGVRPHLDADGDWPLCRALLSSSAQGDLS